MIPLTIAQVAVAVRGDIAGVSPDAVADSVIDSVVVDSRAVLPGTMFVAIAGERVDGHDYARQAVSAGAAVVLASRALADADGPLPCIVVDDPVLALGRLAQWYRRELLTCTVVGVTGSSGKTTTKDLIASVLSALGPTARAEGSFNTEVGVPLTILMADENTEYLVLEMGMRGAGHISYLVDLATPDVGVVINVGTAHLGMLGTTDAIAHAKGELVEGLPADAIAVLNFDDPQVRAMADRTPARVVTFGEAATVDIRATDIRLDSLARPSFTLHLNAEDQAQPISLQLSGEHYVSNALAAAATGFALGASIEQVADALRGATAQSRWRMEVREAPSGVIVVNDAYNANPDSMRAALKSLAAMAAGRRTWAVLGEMRELGAASLEEHDSIGRLAVRLDISHLVCVGEATKVMHLAAANEGSWGDEALYVPDADAAITLLRERLLPGDVVLVKASRSVGLEVIADALLEGGAA